MGAYGSIWEEAQQQWVKVWDLFCFFSYYFSLGFPGGSDSKESAYSAEDRVQSLGQEDPLEKGMATHSSILAWRIPWTEEPAEPQSIGSKDSEMTEKMFKKMTFLLTCTCENNGEERVTKIPLGNFQGDYL